MIIMDGKILLNLNGIFQKNNPKFQVHLSILKGTFYGKSLNNLDEVKKKPEK